MPHKRQDARRPQFGLRTLILGGLFLGTVAGTYGPTMAKSIRSWLEPPLVPPLQKFVLPMAPQRDWDSAQTGYYESAETPLR